MGNTYPLSPFAAITEVVGNDINTHAAAVVAAVHVVNSRIRQKLGIVKTGSLVNWQFCVEVGLSASPLVVLEVVDRYRRAGWVVRYSESNRRLVTIVLYVTEPANFTENDA